MYPDGLKLKTIISGKQKFEKNATCLLSKPPEIGAEGPDFGWSATSEASHGTPEGGLFKKTAK